VRRRQHSWRSHLDCELIDSSGNFWLFGGNGLDASGTLGYLNDVWEYQP
jgi:hypothetical protein